MKIKKRVFVVGIILFYLMFINFILINVSLVNGFSISSLYGKTSVLKMEAGESREIVLVLRSDSDEGDISVSADVVEEGKIFEIINKKKEYKVLGDGKGVEVKLKVKIPENAEIGEKYVIAIKFGGVSEGSSGGLGEEEGGAVSFTTSTTKTINVEVVNESIDPGKVASRDFGRIRFWLIFLVFGVVLLIVLIIIIYPFVKKKRNIPLR